MNSATVCFNANTDREIEANRTSALNKVVTQIGANKSFCAMIRYFNGFYYTYIGTVYMDGYPGKILEITNNGILRTYNVDYSDGTLNVTQLKEINV